MRTALSYLQEEKMANYAIGDLQGHLTPLKRLLDKIKYEPTQDTLWFVGDLVNRGPESLETLRFIKSLPSTTKVVLGNHDLYLLQVLYSKTPKRYQDTLDEILNAPDKDELSHWLRRLPFCHYDEKINVFMAHAGLAPIWTIQKALQLGQELEQICRTDAFFEWMNLYFNPHPHQWSDGLHGLPRWQIIGDYFTRMRFTLKDGSLDWRSHDRVSHAPEGCYPWYACPARQNWDATIVFGHWASLLGKTGFTHFQAVDTGCHWGGHLIALNLETLQRTF